MEEMEQSKQDEGNLRKTYIKGVVLGVLLTICVILTARSGAILYRYLVYGEINYDTKAKMIYNVLEKKYVGDIDKKELYEGIYTGMVYNTTDKYSYYIPASEYEEFKQKNEGEYVGIGIGINLDENANIKVNYVIEGSPAYEAGIAKGDIIECVDDVEANADNYLEAVDMIKGVEDTEVKLRIYKAEQDKESDITVKRAKVNNPTVASKMLDDKIGYIRISQFEGVTYDQFKAALDKLNGEGMERIIVDVRNNPGGLLTSVSSILDELLGDGVITYTEDKNGEREYVYSKGKDLEIPMVVLVNGSSASASELFSAALHDRNIAELVGETTYGKGVVQSTFPFSDGSALKITTAKYYTPNGVCIDGVGVKPDYELAASDDFEMSYISGSEAEIAENDTQLAKAIEVVKNK
jgi:carboxyl-terminal processing protease